LLDYRKSIETNKQTNKKKKTSNLKTGLSCARHRSYNGLMEGDHQGICGTRRKKGFRGKRRKKKQKNNGRVKNKQKTTSKITETPPVR